MMLINLALMVLALVACTPKHVKANAPNVLEIKEQKGPGWIAYEISPHKWVILSATSRSYKAAKTALGCGICIETPTSIEVSVVEHIVKEEH